jgi:hypothetical protein
MKRFFSIIFCIFGVLGLLSVLRDIGDSNKSFDVEKDLLLFNTIFSVLCLIISYILKSGKKYISAIKTENCRNFVELTPGAVELTKKKIQEHNYPSDTALRIIKQDDPTPSFEVKFDLLANDDQDWVGESSGIFVMIEKNIASQLEKFIIDAKNGEFIFYMQQKSN